MAANDPIFFPNSSSDDPAMKHCEVIVEQEFDKMKEFLDNKVDDGVVKDKLRDQLIWLQYQIRYFKECHDQHMLEENFNWVVANFNHDLSLSPDMEFKYVQKLLGQDQ